MKSFPKRFLWIISLVLLLSYGCTAATFSGLQSEFITLYQQKDKCKKTNEETGAIPVECMGDHDQALLDLAKEAEKLAGKTDDARTRIGVLRLGALAAWQAGEKGFGTANDLASKGSRLCESLDKRRFGAPRDCALLKVLPALVAQDSWVAQLQAIGKRDTPDKLEFFKAFSGNYKLNTWDAIVRHEALLASDPRIDRALLNYLKLQKNYFYCTTVKALKHLQQLINALDDPKRLEKEFNKVLGQRDEMDRALGQDRIPCRNLP